MHARRFRYLGALALAGVWIAGAAPAQTVKLGTRARSARTGTMSVTAKPQGSGHLLTIRAGNADAAALFGEIASKAGVRILMPRTLRGVVTASFDDEPLDNALRVSAASAGLTVRKVYLPKETAATAAADTVAALSAALSNVAANATVVDVTSGRSVVLAFSNTAPKVDAGLSAVYYVFPTPRTGVKTSDSGSTDEAVANASAALSGLPTQQKLQAVRDLQRQMFESMTDEERQQMRPQGGPGMGGPPPDGFGGPPPDGFGGPPPQ